MATSHFAATPHSDVVCICAHDFQRRGDAFGTTENAGFRAFINLRSQFHLHHCSQRTLTEIVSKITPNLGLILLANTKKHKHQITISSTSLFSANFNGNRVKNHPKPWTCPLRSTTGNIINKTIIIKEYHWEHNQQDYH